MRQPGRSGYRTIQEESNEVDSRFSHVKVVAWNWNFGDGRAEVRLTTSSTKHTFATKGYFNVTLTVFDADGQSHSVTKRVKIEKLAN